ncbi:MAG: phosphoribosylanthranilate isomerase [Planctomycetia bacterium]|nr:phosphoribosylanthranilate isomerase [Planctomycetia bacterium]
MSFRIKICGVTSVADALEAVQAGADAIGVNFFSGSPRCVEPSRAREIAAVLPEGVQCIGVFVDPELPQLEAAVALGLHAVQLHGDEQPALLAHFCELPVIKAFRLGDDGLAPVRAFLEQARLLGCPPEMVLVDAHRPGAYGGTGATADWNVVASYAELAGPPLVLAGGLTADNVADAIRTVRPAAVDTASGVESSPGVKDAQKMQDFVQAAMWAFSQLAEGNRA